MPSEVVKMTRREVQSLYVALVGLEHANTDALFAYAVVRTKRELQKVVQSLQESVSRKGDAFEAYEREREALIRSSMVEGSATPDGKVLVRDAAKFNADMEALRVKNPDGAQAYAARERQVEELLETTEDVTLFKFPLSSAPAMEVSVMEMLLPMVDD